MAAEEEKEGVRQRAVADGDDDWCWRHNNRDTIAWISSLREAYCHYYASCPKRVADSELPIPNLELLTPADRTLLAKRAAASPDVDRAVRYGVDLCRHGIMSYFRVDARQWTDRQLVHILAHVFGMDSRTKRKVGCCRCGSIFRDCVCEREGDEARVPVYVAVFEHDGDLEVGPRYERRRQIWRQEGEGAMQIYWAKKAADGHALESEKWFRLC